MMEDVLEITVRKWIQAQDVWKDMDHDWMTQTSHQQKSNIDVESLVPDGEVC